MTGHSAGFLIQRPFLLSTSLVEYRGYMTCASYVKSLRIYRSNGSGKYDKYSKIH